MKITILGSGAWGTGIAKLFADKHNDVVLFGNMEVCNSINTEHRNTFYFPDVILPENISYTMNLEEALEDAEIVVFSVPSVIYRTIAHQVNQLLKRKVHIFSTAKGFDPKTFERLSQVLRDEISEEHRYDIVTLIGPSYAEEVVHGKLTAIAAVSVSREEAEYAQKAISSPLFRVYTNTDEIGAECAAALKNVIAIAAGIIYGLDQEENAKAALITRGITEILRFGTALGGKKETFLGLTGIGDLMLTCSSMKSRNYSLGYEIGKADDAKSVLSRNTKTVEGVNTSVFATSMAKKLGIEMPITETVCRILTENLRPSQAIKLLMSRDLKSEE